MRLICVHLGQCTVQGSRGTRVNSRACLVLHGSQWHRIIGFMNDSFYVFICDRFVTGCIVFIGVSSPAWVWAHLYCGARTEWAGREVRAAVRWDPVRGSQSSQRHHPQSGGGRKVEARARCGAGAHRLQEQDTQDTPASSTRQRSRCARCQSRVNVVTLQWVLSDYVLGNSVE